MKNKMNIIKNAIMLYGMSFAKMIFPLLTLPYLTRILSVDSYGAVAYVKSTMSFLQVIVDFGFMLSGTKEIVECNNDEQRIGVVAGDIVLARILVAGICFLGLLVTVFLVPILSKFKLYTILSFGSVFLSIFLLDYLFRGIEKMEIITIRYVFMRGISTLLTFIFVKSDKDILLIPILDLIGSLAAIVLVFKELKILNINIRISSLKNILKELKVSCVYFTSNMASTIFAAANTLIIGMTLSTSDVAYWSVCIQLVNAVQALYTPITDAIYPEMIKQKNINLVGKISITFFPLLLLGCVFTFITARWDLLIIAGEKYVSGYKILRLLIPVFFFSFYSILLGWPTLGAIQKETQVMKTTIFSALFQLLGFIILRKMNMFIITNIAILRSLTEFALVSTRFIYVLKYRKSFNAEVIK